MHFEFLVEDASTARLVDLVAPRVLGTIHTYRTHAYRGLGRLPRGLEGASVPRHRVLLDRLPNVLQGYSNAYASLPHRDRPVIVVVCDLDDRCMAEFRRELLGVIERIKAPPHVHICLAIEETEAWLLGDKAAVRRAYPRAKTAVLDGYEFDAVCGTWERLADAVFDGGAAALRRRGMPAVGLEKCRWAEAIAPHMDVPRNESPSFRYFCAKLRRAARGA